MRRLRHGGRESDMQTPPITPLPERTPSLRDGPLLPSPARGGGASGLSADLFDDARSVAPQRAEAWLPGEARRGRCLPLARARPPPGAVGGARSAQGIAAAAVRSCRCSRCRRRASRHAAHHAALRACGERLPHAQAFAQSPSLEFPARSHQGRALRCLRRSQSHARRGKGERRRRRAGAPAPRLGGRRRVHDHRGRDGRSPIR